MGLEVVVEHTSLFSSTLENVIYPIGSSCLEIHCPKVPQSTYQLLFFFQYLVWSQVKGILLAKNLKVIASTPWTDIGWVPT